LSYVIAVDSGGTFTDCVVLDHDGRGTRAKVPSTPPLFEEAVLASVSEAARRLELPLAELLGETEIFAHGTTVATNILITRTGARTALLTTRGHEDAIVIGRTHQKVAGLTESEIIDVARLSKAQPIVPRSRIYGIDERVDRAGQVVVPLDVDRLDELIERLRDEGVEAIAISFLWSFLAPEHEHQLRDRLQAAADANGHKWFVTASSDLAPVIGEYERTSTTAVNAYVTPGVDGYLQRMRDRLREAGHRGPVTVMHSAGGVSSVDEARRHAASLLLSGPAGGILGARALAERLGIERVIATDVGGTSFDVGLIIDGEPAYASAPVFEKYPVVLPVIDVTSIGSGGGSIAWIEPGTGVLQVGPQSAGAKPGPVCYGAGGKMATVADANLVLGRLNPAFFLGGRLRLDVEKATEAIREQVAEPLGIEAHAAAAAIVEIVDSHMADMIRKVTVERGLDPSQFTAFGYGGAGGLHVGSYARKLRCPHVVIPEEAAVFSAFGISMSDVKRVVMVSDPARAPFDLVRWSRHFAELEATLVGQLHDEGLPTQHLLMRRSVELQFHGQVHTVRVPVQQADLEAEDGGAALVDRFTELYEARYGPGTAYRKVGAEALTFVVEGFAALPRRLPAPLELGDPDAAGACEGERDVYLHEVGAFTAIPVYRAERLTPGNEFAGPAIVEAEDTTVLVHPAQWLWVDGYRNLRLELAERDR